ncbi:lactococcin 972 family bacteriocin [Corynebacterium nasicanis]|uniref:Lactococcin 972 family bacteriocin n=1 Tax=Corynebacterium nasicanis TaxID=1448267 RepID=A0ABW1QD26_9CORY
MATESVTDSLVQVPIHDEIGHGVTVIDLRQEGEPRPGEATPKNEPIRDYYITKYPGAGQEWGYGKVTGHFVSNYLHPSACHGSTVKRGARQDRATDIIGGKWSRARISELFTWGTASYYYHTC